MMEYLRSTTHIDPPVLALCLAVWWAAWLLVAYIGNRWIDWKHGIRR